LLVSVAKLLQLFFSHFHMHVLEGEIQTANVMNVDFGVGAKLWGNCWGTCKVEMNFFNLFVSRPYSGIIHVVNEIENWCVVAWESHGTHIRVLIWLIFGEVVSLYSSTNSVRAFQNIKLDFVESWVLPCNILND